MENNELLDLTTEDSSPKKANTLLNVMCILGYIGNIAFLLIGIIFLVVGNEIMAKIIPNERNDAENVQTILTYVFIAIIIISALSIIGLILAHQKKTAGVIIYSIFNGMWAIVNLISLQPNNMIIAVISLAFIIVIAINHKK
jgi:hypothetical protein